MTDFTPVELIFLRLGRGALPPKERWVEIRRAYALRGEAVPGHYKMARLCKVSHWKARSMRDDWRDAEREFARQEKAA